MSGILSGVIITLCCLVCNKVGGLAGACLFSFGLMTICIAQYDLYTGKVGFLATKKIKLERVLEIFYQNAIGCLLVGWIYPYNIEYTAPNMPIEQMFALSIICGALMALGILLFQKTRKLIFPAMVVVIFIMSGALHSIATMGYLALASAPIQDWMCVIPIAIGNALGGMGIVWADSKI